MTISPENKKEIEVEIQRQELIQKWQELKPAITPLVFTTINGENVAIKDESQNRTGTYKDKHGWMMGQHYLHNVFPSRYTYFLVSTGNAAIADVAYADMLNELMKKPRIQVINFFPKHYDKKVLGPDSFGRFTDGYRFWLSMENYLSASNEKVDFDEKFWNTNACREHLNKKGLCLTPENSMDITEGFNPTYTQVAEEFVQQIWEHTVGRAGKTKEQMADQYYTSRGDFFPQTLLVTQFGAGMLYDDCKQYIQEQKLPIEGLQTTPLLPPLSQASKGSKTPFPQMAIAKLKALKTKNKIPNINRVLPLIMQLFESPLINFVI